MTFINIPKSELDRPLVAAGEHPARIAKVTVRDSAAKNKMLGISWTITGTEPPAGQQVYDMITLVQEAYWKLGLLFAATGFEPDDQGFNDQGLVGLEALITVTEDEYEGVPRNKVTGYKKI
jgi:hypothetical protein